VADGGALVNDGTYIYAFQGKTNVFWRYNPTANTWAAMANALGTVGQGGALVFVPGTGSVDRQTTMDATPTLVSTGTPISVTMGLLSNAGDVNNVAPTNPLTVTASNASAVCTGPTPASQNVISGTVAYFRWNCTLSTTANATGMITFTASAAGSGVQFAAASTESVIVVPLLTFRVTVNNPPGVNVVNNTATLIDGSGALTPKPSNTTQTAVSGNLGDYVWADLDGDGVQDPGETGLAGVQVCATPTGGGAAVCVTTDALGAYRIVGLSAGASYSVTLTPATIPAGYTATTPTTLTRTATTEGVNDADFGLRPPGQARIGDTVWLDANEDGVLDADEEGLPGITVRLYDSTGTTLLATTTTDASGVYTFTGVYSGTYRVQVDTASIVTSPYGVVTTLAAAMDLVSVAGATSPLDNPLTVVVPSDSAVVDTADFGFNWGGSIGDYVWRDDDADGVQDGGEAPIAGAIVLLYFDSNGNGVLDPLLGDYQVGFAMTDGSGAYLFDNLPPGAYLVDVYEDSMTTPGGAYRELIPTTGDVLAVNLTPKEDYLDADFGYYEGALVQGVVFWDADRNGLPDASETRLQPVTVTLTGFDNNGAPVSLTTTTNSEGSFSFIVAVGTYTVTYSQPSVQAINPGLIESTTAESYTVEAEAGPDSHIQLLFGVDNSGQVGDRVWNDADGDGAQDADESGLPGVTVQLYDAAGVTLLASTVTTATGGYLFEGLADATYKVKVLTTTVPLPAGFTQTGDPDATLDNTGTATVSGGGSVLTMDFGYRAAGATYSVSGTVWNDLNGDAIRSGEPGIAGVQVAVTYTPTAGSPITVLTTVDASGQYTVTGIPQGSDVAISPVSSTLPNAAYTATTATTRTITNITANQPNQDFGYREYRSSLSGAVCVGDGDGQCETGEPLLSAVTITLYYAATLNDPFAVISATLTNASGQYTFTYLQPGYYQIVETNVPGYLSLADRDGGNPDNISVSLAVSQTVTGRDFEDVSQTALQVAKTPDLQVIASGQPVTFTIAVTNTGHVTLTSVTAADAVVPACAQPIGTLGPGASASYSCTVVSATADFTNTVAVTGTLPTGQQLAASDTARVLLYVTIGDRTWLDTNGDGIHQPITESFGLSSVPLRITGVDVVGRSVDITVTTSVTGHYSVDLPPGVYTITAPATWGGYQLTSSGTLTRTLTTGGVQDLTVDFGYQSPTAAGLLAFSARFEPADRAVHVSWTVRARADVQGFLVFRAVAAAGPYKQVSPMPVLAAPGVADYSYLDAAGVDGRVSYWYQLQILPASEWLGPVASAPFYQERIFVPLISR